MAENALSIFGADASVQQKYFDALQRSEHLEPEKALLQAILEDAVHCYRKYVSARDRAGREQFREAEEWIMGGANGWIFSFNNVCEYLGLDPEYVRRGVRESKLAAGKSESKEPRRALHGRAA